MQKQKYTSTLLSAKCVPIMADSNKNFRKKIERYELLNMKKEINPSEKREKVILKDFISDEIKKYKTNSQSWIQSNWDKSEEEVRAELEEKQNA